jgi:Bacterial PH domain
MLAAITITLVILLAAGGWFLLPAPLWLSWIEWRTSRLRLRADASGITVVNLVRRHEVRWEQVRGVWAEGSDFHDFPATVTVERSKGRLWGVRLHVTFGLGKKRRRAVALRIAEVGRAYGYGFPTGEPSDLEALHCAGLFDESDPELHQAWWDAHEPRQSAVR